MRISDLKSKDDGKRMRNLRYMGFSKYDFKDFEMIGPYNNLYYAWRFCGFA